MNEGERTIAERTRAFAVRVIRLFNALPRNQVARVIGLQVLRSGTAPGAHCREGRRTRSVPEMISKFETAVQELNETLYWFQLLIDAEIVSASRLESLISEANEVDRHPRRVHQNAQATTLERAVSAGRGRSSLIAKDFAASAIHALATP